MEKITALDHLRACAELAKTFTTGLVSKLAKSTADALEELESLKADKQGVTCITIPASEWTTDSDPLYPNYYDVEVEGLTARDRTEIRLAPSSIEAAKACGLCPASETTVNKIRVRAASAPMEEIMAEYWIERGKE